MKNTGIKILSVIIVVSVVFSLCSCRLNKKDTSGIMTTNRELTLSTAPVSVKTTDLSVKAVAPKGSDKIIEYFNNSLEYFVKKDFEFTEKYKTSLESFSAGSLWNVEGATQSYRSTLESSFGDMMGVGSLNKSFYVGDDISEDFAIRAVEAGNLKSCSAKAEGSNVKVAFNYKPSNGEGMTNVRLLTNYYMSSGSFSSKIGSYGASSSGATATISGVKLSATIDYSTNNFVSVKIEYTTSFYAEEVSFDYVSGGPVKGTTKTEIVYGNFKEK